MRNWLWLLISVASAAHAAPPTRVAISYELLRNGTQIAETTYTLQHDSRRYEITEKWRGIGLYALVGAAKRTSRGMVAADGLRPLEFVDERTGRATARAAFDWQAKTVTLQYKGEPRTERLPADANDRLAFLFDFAFEPKPLGTVAFDLFDGRGRSRHVYTADGKARITTPAGTFDTVHVVRAGDDDERAEIWLAEQIGYLPVRVLVTKPDGERFDQLMKSLSRQ